MRAQVMASTASAAAASDQCTPTRPPIRPTVTPLKARNPRLALLNRPSTRPRIGGGALSCTSVRAIGVADEERRAAGKQRHGNDNAVAGNVAHGLHDVG